MTIDAEIFIGLLDDLEFPETEIVDIFINIVKSAAVADISKVFFHNLAFFDSSKLLDEDEIKTVSDIAVPLMAWNLGQISELQNAVNIKKAEESWTSIIAGEKGYQISRAIFRYWLTEKSKLKLFLSNNKEEWASEISNYLSNSSSFNEKMLLKFLILSVLNIDTYHCTIGKIKEKCDGQVNLNTISEFVEKKNFLLPACGILKTGFLLESTSKATKSSKAGPRIVGHVSSFLGWLNRKDGPSAYRVRSVGLMEYVPKLHTGGCLLGNTSILMELGDSLAVENLQENDVILGDAGEPGLISHEKLVYAVESQTFVYGINDGAAFFTADHPFWTQDGWRAIDPVTAKEENNWLKVGQLSEYDRVCKVVAHNIETRKVEYEWVEINSFSKAVIEPGTKVYGIHIREGPRSCHADGYLVHLNYPEITNSRLANLPSHFRKESKSTFKRLMEPLLKQENLFNEDEFPTNLSSGKISNVPKPLSAYPDGCVPLEEVTVLNARIIHTGNILSKKNKYQKLSIVRGNIFLNDSHITSTKRISHDQMVWTEEFSDGITELGTLCFDPDRLSGYGKIICQRKEMSAEDATTTEISSECFTFINQPMEFVCQKTTVTLKELHIDDTIKQIGQSLQNFGTIVFGREETDDEKNKVIFSLHTPEITFSSADLLGNVVFEIDHKNQLNFHVLFPAEYQPIVGYTRISGTLTWNYRSFEGEVIPFDATKPGNKGEALLFMGIAKRSEDYNTKVNKVREYALANVKSHPLLSRSALAISKRSVPSKLLQFADSVSSNYVSLQDLSMVIVPASEVLLTRSFEFTKEAMMASVSAEWREQIFGINADQKVEDDQKHYFLEHVFGTAFIGLHILWNKDLGNKILDEESRNKLLYFWNGNAKESLSQLKDFSMLTYASSIRAFTSLSPQLQKYVNKTNTKDWAKLLFDYFIALNSIQPLALSMSMSSSMSVLQKSVMLFEILDPGSNYAVDFCRNLIARQIYLMSDFYTGSEADRKSMYSFVCYSVKCLTSQIINNKGFLGQILIERLKPLLTESMDELGVTSEKRPDITLKLFMVEAELVLSQIVNIWKETKGSFWQRISDGLSRWSKEYITNHKTGKFLACLWPIAIAGFAFYASAKEMTGWKEEDLSQKPELVELLLEHVISVTSTMPDSLETFSRIDEGFYSLDFAKNWTSRKHRYDALLLVSKLLKMQSLGEHDDQNIMSQMANETTRSTADVKAAEAKISRWQTLFSITESMAQVNIKLALSAASLWLGPKVLNCFHNEIPVPEDLRETVSAIITGIETIAKLFRMPIESLHFPLTGMFLAEAGVTLATASVDIHSSHLSLDQKVSQKFVENELKSFLRSVSNPPNNWVESYRKKHKKKTPELTEEQKMIKSMLESHARNISRKATGEEPGVPC